MTFPPSLYHKSMADPLSPVASIETIPPEQAWLTELFNTFLRARIPAPQAYTIARHQADEVVQAIRRALYPTRMSAGITGDSLIVGSVGKRTALAPIHSVDVLYLLPSKLRISRAADAHKVIHAGLCDQFEHFEFSGDELSVSVSAKSLRVRVIPALEIGAGYKIPGPVTLQHASGWRIANPISEAATLSLSDSLNTGTTRGLLTVMKSWKEAVGAQIPTLALEVLIQDYFATQKRMPSLPADFKAFVAWGRSKTPGTITAPGGQTSIHVDDSWHGCAKAAYWRATLAEQSMSHEPQKTALEWRYLLGVAFPVPEDTASSLPPLLEACA